MSDHTKYQTALQTELEQVTNELKALGFHDPETDDWEAKKSEIGMDDPDPNIDADAVEETITNQGTLAVLETRYRNIKRALQKIEDGTYGICEISGEEIEAARLDAFPAARTCIEHSDQAESLPL